MIVLEVYSLSSFEEDLYNSDILERRVNLLVFSELAGATRWADESWTVPRADWRQFSEDPPKWIARTVSNRYVATEVELDANPD